MMTDYVTGVLLVIAGLLAGFCWTAILMAALAAKHKARADRLEAHLRSRGHAGNCAYEGFGGDCDCGYAEAIGSHGAEAH